MTIHLLRKRLTAPGFAVAIGLTSTGQAPAQARPTIAASEPRFWASDVSPSTRQVRLTFDQPMRPGFSDWMGQSSVLPERLELEDRMTDDLLTQWIDVGLEPGTVYVFGLNERGISGVGFQNDRGKEIDPRFLVFKTSGEPADPALAPPVVESSEPRNLQMDVDPSKQGAISITFDRPMNDDGHGLILTAGETEIDLAGVPFRYTNGGTTFVLDYPLRPQVLYRATLNSETNIGFRSAERIPMWPQTMTFRTTAPSEPMPELTAEADQPPFVVRSEPEGWEQAVDPGSELIVLKFNQPVRAGFTSWTGSSALVPEFQEVEAGADGTREEEAGLSAEKFSADGTAVSLRVSLERGRTYVLCLNEREQRGVGFQSERGVAMKRRYLVFRTRGIPPSEMMPPKMRTSIPEDGGDDFHPEAEVKVTFDRPMDTSRSGFELLVDGDPVDMENVLISYSADGLTCHLQGRLEPDTSYTLRLNSDTNIGFRSAQDVPMWPEEIQFETGAGLACPRCRWGGGWWIWGG